MKFVVFAIAASLAAASGAAAQTADPALGKRLWMQCRACHATRPDEGQRAGPNLNGIFGAKAGTRTAFPYSPALKASGIVWTAPTLDAFIANPAKTVPGNRMGFGGMPDARSRAALIDYLKAETK
jgi:cytochrome c